MKFINKEPLLLLAIFVGIFLRFHKLDEIPPAVYVDEAAIGYNAFSILKTGRDEYGYFMPVFLRSFNAFSSPLYIYLSTVPIWLFGLSAYSTRFLSAFCGVLNIFVIYKIIGIFGHKRKFTIYATTLLFAISPWSIFFSRGAFEANLGLLLLSISMYFLLTFKNTKKLLIAAVVLGISTYAYQSLRIIPLIILPIHFLIYKNKDYTFKFFIKMMAIFMILIIPQLVVLQSPAFSSRASGLFYTDAVMSQANKILFMPHFVSVLLSLFRELMAQFVAYFSFMNLFLLGDSDLQRSMPEMGVFSLWVAVPLLVGIRKVFKKLSQRNMLFIALSLLAFALPAALARDPFSTLRALNLILPMTIIISFGIDSLMIKIGNYRGAIMFFALCAFSLTTLWRSYFVLFPEERAGYWNYGYKELAFIVKNSNNHYVIDTSRVKPPHILLAFHLKMDPKKYQEYSKTKIIKGYYDDIEFDTYYNLANFETRTINWEQDIYQKQILVGDEYAISLKQAEEHFLTKVFEIRDPIGKMVFQGYQTDPETKCRMTKSNINCDK